MSEIEKAARTAVTQMRAIIRDYLPAAGQRAMATVYLDTISIALGVEPDNRPVIEFGPGVHPRVYRLVRAAHASYRFRLVLFQDYMVRNEYLREVIDVATYPHARLLSQYADEIVMRGLTLEEEIVRKGEGLEPGLVRPVSKAAHSFWTAWALLLQDKTLYQSAAPQEDAKSRRTMGRFVNNYLYRKPTDWTGFNAFLQDMAGMNVDEPTLNQIVAVVGELPLPADD